MKIEQKEVILRKLIASEGKILVSKNKDDEGNYLVKCKEMYLGDADDENNYEEIDDIEENEEA